MATGLSLRFGPDDLPSASPTFGSNPKGERFFDEGMAFYDTSMGNANARYKEGYTYSLFDDCASSDYFMEQGSTGASPGRIRPGTKPLNIERGAESRP